jgi:hypothetical protein
MGDDGEWEKRVDRGDGSVEVSLIAFDLGFTVIRGVDPFNRD